MKRNLKKNGFTMIEATIAMVILAIAAAGVLLPFANAASVQQEAARQVLASNLATELMEKVLLTDPNGLIATYNGYEETEGAMLDTSDNPLTDVIYDGFSRSVGCQAVAVKSVPLVEVTVSVAYYGNEMTCLKTLVSE